MDVFSGLNQKGSFGAVLSYSPESNPASNEVKASESTQAVEPGQPDPIVAEIDTAIASTFVRIYPITQSPIALSFIYLQIFPASERLLLFPRPDLLPTQ
ncbi:hypothetical protein IFO70_13220 [Phormidium tenue FACHB-886]|nr:hypothetical protein [Phormidium tenue FACHB-886]